MYVGKKINDLLAEQGKTQAELLEYIGLDPKKNSVGAIVRGNPTARRLEQVADFFGVSIDEFFDRKYSSNGINIAEFQSRFNRAAEYYDKQKLETKIEFLETLLKEKDERIALLTKINEIFLDEKSPLSRDKNGTKENENV